MKPKFVLFINQRKGLTCNLHKPYEITKIFNIFDTININICLSLNIIVSIEALIIFFYRRRINNNKVCISHV